MTDRIFTPEVVGTGAPPPGPQAMIQAVLSQITQLIGKTPLLPQGLVAALVENDWPSEARLHPGDFWVLTMPGALPWAAPFQVYKDQAGPYFYVSRTKVRPNPPALEVSVDLTDYVPVENRLITPAKFATTNDERVARRK